MTLQIISIAIGILSPLITALVMWGYRSDQTGIKNTIQQIAKENAEAITRNAASIEKIAARHSERMDKIEESLNNLKSELPMVFTLREDSVAAMNRLDDKLNRIIYMKGGKDDG